MAVNMVNKKLAIAIPTYKRQREFARLTGQLSDQINLLDKSLQKNISINVLENPSSFTAIKKNIFNQLPFGMSNVSWLEHECNIGGDNNINEAYKSGRDSDYVWVIGDDEQICCKALENVFRVLNSNSNLGLLILLSNSEYRISRRLKNYKWKNYALMAKELFSIQPHLLIAHTLISANIIKSSIYSYQYAAKDITKFSKRWSLPFCFSHMKGIISGLSENDSYEVLLSTQPIISTISRSEPSDLAANHGANMIKLHKMYMLWLIHEFGLINQPFHCQLQINFIYPESPVLLALLAHRFIQKLSNLTFLVKNKLKGRIF
jgi:hypothetical protein